MKSGRSGAHKPSRLGLICKANKGSDVRTGDLGVLTARETSPTKSVMLAQLAQGEYRYKYKVRLKVSLGHMLKFTY